MLTVIETVVFNGTVEKLSECTVECTVDSALIEVVHGYESIFQVSVDVEIFGGRIFG